MIKNVGISLTGTKPEPGFLLRGVLIVSLSTLLCSMGWSPEEHDLSAFKVLCLKMVDYSAFLCTKLVTSGPKTSTQGNLCSILAPVCTYTVRSTNRLNKEFTLLLTPINACVNLRYLRATFEIRVNWRRIDGLRQRR